mmetsp:Transcript_37908/g.49910  ORF Transcript_37908/g.49910 Transcript_37908/m.49910 type:complete len:495 (+) Transcript_37908:77-1561(+)
METLPSEINTASLSEFLTHFEGSFEFVPQYGVDVKAAFGEATLAFVASGRQPTETEGLIKPSLEDQALGLRTLRTLMREKKGIDKLRNEEALKLYLECLQEEGDSENGYEVCLNGLRCVTNTMHENVAGRELFLKLGGLTQFHDLLKKPRLPVIFFFVIRNLYFVLGHHQSEIPQIMCNGFAPTIMATLAWCVKFTPPLFPEGEYRCQLATECLRMLFLLRSMEVDNKPLVFAKEGASSDPQCIVCGEAVENPDETVNEILKLNDVQISEEQLNATSVTSFHIDIADIICEVFPLLRSHGNENVNIRSVKLEAVNVLMYLPASTFHRFVEAGVIEDLVIFLEQQIDQFANDIRSEHTIQLTPILVALTNLATPDICIRKRIKELIFPPEADKIWQEKKRKEEELGQLEMDELDASERKMHPIDAPKGTLRAKLISLLTAIDSTTKRYAGELLYALCNNESEEFVLRTGFGNAVVMLQSKGLVDLPQMMAANSKS